MDRKIISDTSCLIALHNINRLNLLKDLFQEIIITKEVQKEFGEKLPSWIKISGFKNLKLLSELEKRLDKGEASSIVLAREISNSTLIIDEIKGRKIAKSLNIEIIGTIGILILANKKGFVEDALNIVSQLIENGFRISDDLMNNLVERFRNY